MQFISAKISLNQKVYTKDVSKDKYEPDDEIMTLVIV